MRISLTKLMKTVNIILCIIIIFIINDNNQCSNCPKRNGGQAVLAKNFFWVC